MMCVVLLGLPDLPLIRFYRIKLYHRIVFSYHRIVNTIKYELSCL